MKLRKERKWRLLLLIGGIIIIMGTLIYQNYKPELEISQSQSFSQSVKNLMDALTINPIHTQYNGNYEILKRTGNESLYDVSFEKKLVLVKNYTITENESGEPLKEPENILIYRQDTIICLEAGWDDKEIIEYKWDEEKQEDIIDKTYTYSIPSILSFSKESIKQEDLDRKHYDNSGSIVAKDFEQGDNYKFCYQANPKLDYYLKFGENSVIVIQGKDIVGDSLLTNVTAESGDVNFTHLNISTIAPYDSLVGYWSFDGDNVNSKLNTSYDFSKENNGGTMVADAVVNSTGCIYDDCLQLDGVGDNMDMGEFDVIEGIYNVSFSMWVKPNELIPHTTLRPFDKDDHFRLHHSIGNDIVLTVYNQSNSFIQASFEDGITDTNWHQIAATYNGTTVTIYVDAVAGGTIGNFPSLMLTKTTTANLWLGGIGGNVWNGSIDEVMFFNTTLTAAQITAIYNNQSARFEKTGTQRVRAVNITNSSTWQDNGFNRVNLTTTFERNLDSNISARIGQFNISVNVSGLVLYMPFEWGSAVDISGYGADGTLEATVSFEETGGLNGTGGFDFTDGTVDQISLPATYAPLDNSKNATWSFWTYARDQGPAGDGYFYGQDGFFLGSDTGGTDDWKVKISNGTAGDGTISDDSGLAININVWQHILVTFDAGDSLKLYINAIEQTGGNWPYDTTNITHVQVESNGYAIGNSNADQRGINATIDQLMIFNRTLTTNEISALYGNQSAKHNIAYYTDYQNLTAVNEFTINKEADFIFPDFKFLAGNLTNPFYTPLLIGDITLETWEFEEVPEDIEYPLFSNYWDNNGTFEDSGTAYFNVTVTHTNNTVYLEIDDGGGSKTNYTAHNSSGDVYNVSVSMTSAGTYDYKFFSWGNGTNDLYNFSETRYYTVNTSDTCIAPASGHWTIDCSDYCNWDSNQNVPANISMIGSGSVTLMSGVNFSFAVKPYYVYTGSGCTFVNNGGGFI